MDTLQEYTSRYCPYCQEKVLALYQDETRGYTLNMFLTVITCGLWLPIWVFMYMTGMLGRHVYLCSKCGSKV